MIRGMPDSPCITVSISPTANDSPAYTKLLENICTAVKIQAASSALNFDFLPILIMTANIVMKAIDPAKYRRSKPGSKRSAEYSKASIKAGTA